MLKRSNITSKSQKCQNLGKYMPTIVDKMH
jgi:hypothetical protein